MPRLPYALTFVLLAFAAVPARADDGPLTAEVRALLATRYAPAPPAFTVENRATPTFTVKNTATPTPKSSRYDPYGFADYGEFLKAVTRAGRHKGRFVLVVGGKDRYVGTYQEHCRVPSGFRGLADGEYDAYLLNGVPVLELRPTPGVSAPPPFAPPGGSITGGSKDTSARTVGMCPSPGPAPGFNVGPVRFRIHTGTPVPAAAFPGGTDCPPAG